MSVYSAIRAIALVNALVLSSGAIAADLRPAAYVSMKDTALPPYNWSGVYGGFHAGYLTGDATNKFSNGNANSADFDGGIIGGQLGVQYMFYNNVVVGAEVSYTGSGTVNGSSSCPNASYACGFKPKGELEVVGRLGYALGNFLPYVKGGYANVDLDSTAQPLFQGFNETHRLDGYVVGGGLEFAISNEVILGVDYSHIELDSERYSQGVAGADRNVDSSMDVIKGRVSIKLTPGLSSSLK